MEPTDFAAFAAGKGGQELLLWLQKPGHASQLADI